MIAKRAPWHRRASRARLLPRVVDSLSSEGDGRVTRATADNGALTRLGRSAGLDVPRTAAICPPDWRKNIRAYRRGFETNVGQALSESRERAGRVDRALFCYSKALIQRNPRAECG